MSPLLAETLAQEVAHGRAELVEAHHAVPVLVRLQQQVLPHLVVHFGPAVAIEQVVEVVERDRAVAVGVQDLEGDFDVGLVLEDLAVDARRDELLEVDDPVAVVVALLDDVVPVDVVPLSQLRVRHLLQLMLVQRPRPVLVQPQELLLQHLQLLLVGAQP